LVSIGVRYIYGWIVVWIVGSVGVGRILVDELEIDLFFIVFFVVLVLVFVELFIVFHNNRR